MPIERYQQIISLGENEYEVDYEIYYRMELMHPDVPYSYEKDVIDVQIISITDEYGEEQNLSEEVLELIKEKL